MPFTVKRSSRARYVRLEVREGTGLTVVVTPSYDVKRLSDLLKKKGRWILDKLARYSKVQSNAGKELKDGDFIPYLGRQVKIVEHHIPGKAVSVSLEDGRLLLNLDSQNHQLNRVLEWWYREEARKLITKKADEICPRLGVNYRRLSIRRAKTRWGSCSQKGNLSFNWKLLMVPEPVIDYVVIHELAHLKEMSHSKKFWTLVAEHCPEWCKHRQYLKDVTDNPFS